MGLCRQNRMQRYKKIRNFPNFQEIIFEKMHLKITNHN